MGRIWFCFYNSLSKFNNDLNLDYDEAEVPSPLSLTKQSTLRLKLQGYRNDLQANKQTWPEKQPLATINEAALKINTNINNTTFNYTTRDRPLAGRTS